MVTGDTVLQRLLLELVHLIGSLSSQLCIFILCPGAHTMRSGAKGCFLFHR